MGRKWLDNYGQEDNYNDSKISIPPGFVGQGYDISGRNYSPAWGGQFQSGGNVESKWEYSNTNGKLIPIAQNGRNLKRLLNENIKKDSNTFINYTKLRNIDPGREIKKQTQKIENVQKKNNVSRKKALEIIQKEEFNKNVARNPQGVGEIVPVEDQSVASKIWEVLTNPATAASYWLNDQRIPDRFSKGERNNLDIATDLFNPFGIINSGKNAVKETISIPKNLYNGEYGEAGSNFLNAGLNTLSVIPVLRELKGVKVPKINTSINSSSVNKELKNINPFLKVEKKDVLKTKPNHDFQVNIDDYKDEISALKKREIEYIDSPEYMNLRMKNTGETEDEILKSIHRIKKNMDRTTFNTTSRLGPSEGEYLNSISTFFSPRKGNFLPSLNFNPSINISSRTRYPEAIVGALDHEIKHGYSPVGTDLGIYRNYPTLKVSIPDDKKFEAYLMKPYEQQVRFNKFKDLLEEHTGLKRGQSITEQHLKDFYENGTYNSLYYNDILNLFKNLDKNVTKKDILNALNQAWSVIPIAGGIGYEALNSEDETPKYQNGGIIKDNNGYWNPDNWGKVVEIDSNDITMKGVNQPLLGISDEGDIQYMEPNKDYKFKGKKVREFPIAQKGKNIVSDQKQFLQSYVDSPMYLHRLRKQFGDEADKEQKIRSNTLKNVKINYPNFPIGTNYGSIAGIYITKKQRDDTINENKYSNTYGQYFKDIKFENPKNFKKGNIYLEKEYKHNIPANGFETVPIHEMGHALDDSGRNMKLDMIAAIYNRLQTGNDNELLDTGFDSVLKNKKPIKFKYETVPTEVSARLQSIRYLLNKTGIYDARKRQFNVKDYEKMINNPYIMNETATQDVINNLKGKNEKEKKENFIWLMNNVAKNNKTENLVPIARNGINNLDENSLQQLDQLTNFTNYNKLSTGGWLDKF